MKQTIGLILLVIAYGLLVPGLTQPMLSLAGNVDKADLVVIGKDIIVENPQTPELLRTIAEVVVSNMVVEGTVEAYQKTRSILGTVEELYQSDFKLVALLIALFSIIFPVIKGLMMFLSYFRIPESLGNKLRIISALISKWSMADVFVIAIFVAFLAANAIKKEAGLLTFQAELGSGFYYFLSYCILSILSAQLLAPPKSSS